jgi:hypothetical protein
MTKNKIFWLHFFLLICPLISMAQDSLESIHFTRFYNGVQFVRKLTNDTCYATDNIDRGSFRTQKVLTSKQFKDWANIKTQCLELTKKSKQVKSIPILYPRDLKGSVVTEIYIKVKDKIYYYKEEKSAEEIPYNFDIKDNHREFCLSDDELFCKLYHRLL